MVCSGAIVSGAAVFQAMLSPGVRVDSGATIERAVLLDGVTVGSGATLRNVIIDKNVVVPAGYQIGINHDHDRARFADRPGCDISDSGLVVIGKGEKLT